MRNIVSKKCTFIEEVLKDISDHKIKLLWLFREKSNYLETCNCMYTL